MQETERIRVRDLPHWDMPGATYFVTSCLHGSIPAQGLIDIQHYQRELAARIRPAKETPTDWKLHCWKLTFARIDHWLDRGPAIRHLENERLAEAVMNSLLHFASERYDVLAFVVMPSHFHWVFRPLEPWVQSLTGTRSPRERVMHSVKGYSSRRCNELLHAKGPFWQDESYDHWIRDLNELERVIYYVEQNPVKAGLIGQADDWQYSSARLRREQGLELGTPLRRIHGGRSPGLSVF